MSLLEQLLAERSKALKEVEDIESLLISRCGWKPPVQSRSVQPVVDLLPPKDPLAVRPPKGDPDDIPTSISYMDEAVEFVKQWDREKFLFNHYLDFIIARNGGNPINEHSARGPLPKLIKKGLIEVAQKGSGRIPVIYRKVANPPPQEEFGLKDEEM